MRISTTAFFGAALAVSALALGSAPAPAIETWPAASAPWSSAATFVELSRRCRNWRYYCEVRYPDKRARFRGCMAIHGCAGGA